MVDSGLTTPCIPVRMCYHGVRSYVRTSVRLCTGEVTVATVIQAKRRSAVLTSSGLACLSTLPTINLTTGCLHDCLYCYIRGHRNYPGERRIASTYRRRPAGRFSTASGAPPPSMASRLRSAPARTRTWRGARATSRAPGPGGHPMSFNRFSLRYRLGAQPRPRIRRGLKIKTYTRAVVNSGWVKTTRAMAASRCW
jgi:hypothetical protein